MRTQFIISSTDVEHLKQQARKLKKDSGIPHHEALDQIAQKTGFNHWHHVSESAKMFEPTEKAYFFGLIIALDIKDAQDFRDPTGRFVEDELAYSLCADDIYHYIREADEDGDLAVDDPHYEEDKQDWMMDGLMNFTFFRFTPTQIPASIDEVVTLVRECSFWPPEFIWYKGALNESPSDQALDENGNVVGIRFSLD